MGKAASRHIDEVLSSSNNKSTFNLKEEKDMEVKGEEEQPEHKGIQNIVAWDEHLIGQVDAKHILEYACILPLKFPSYFKDERTKDGKGGPSKVRLMLFWGPPGTGKTKLAREFCKDFPRCRFLSKFSQQIC
eukprot:TRINITY_DN12960_c0_g1_i1.p1 TRINITY_DN12960_c0_g1~~TRINITY_DN12960_c0_g1_i1.p1  ORF type:complete len:132 (-),score=21.19 TRINITY_DN12960_c0_g1_i1:75-470(-)